VALKIAKNSSVVASIVNENLNKCDVPLLTTLFKLVVTLNCYIFVIFERSSLPSDDSSII
jgi:hypothetical protein